MKTIEHSYGTNLDWVEPLAKQMDGKVKNNFIVVPEDKYPGIRYVLDCGDGIVAYYVDVHNEIPHRLIQKNKTNDFVCLYYNLTEGKAKYSYNNVVQDLGRWQYNLIVMDSSLDTDYLVEPNSKTFVLCIFIKKKVIEEFAKKNNINFRDIDKITDSSKNTIIRFDRMSNESFHILADLRKLKVGGPVFDLNLNGTVQLLLSNYLKKMATHRIILQTVNEYDVANIVASQMFLISNIESHFPSIQLMARNANMSESKFKNLFKKITGITPNAFFMDNKLLLAKELLEENKLTISQVSDRFNFTNNSYFASKFKEHFGVSPKAFLNQL
ncbi:helix-turn-helix domain-containing protein [Flavobacterium aquidurense]|uniref:Putative transcriptional regulator n=1 Tax=Flavobacterium aquidurense TaxID=362413 RepID=A0A0N8VMS2_9FLAO|nr:AraC family transcriptional regulator [Flavobacterium aquidurense]KQB40116.1 putative transcriptional regulator [Flavobacterium aquidurense]